MCVPFYYKASEDTLGEIHDDLSTGTDTPTRMLDNGCKVAAIETICIPTNQITQVTLQGNIRPQPTLCKEDKLSYPGRVPDEHLIDTDSSSFLCIACSYKFNHNKLVLSRIFLLV